MVFSGLKVQLGAGDVGGVSEAFQQVLDVRVVQPLDFIVRAGS